MAKITTIYCTKCKADIKTPFLPVEEKKQLLALYNNDKKLAMVEKLKGIVELNFKDSKLFITHFNRIGNCNRCNYDQLKGENITCPQCKAFNLNWE